jgi:hypothetical protein
MLILMATPLMRQTEDAGNERTVAYRQSTTDGRRIVRTGPDTRGSRTLGNAGATTAEHDKSAGIVRENMSVTSLARLPHDACVAKVRGDARPTTIRSGEPSSGPTQRDNRVEHSA